MTDNQKPSWLKDNTQKVEIVDHKTIIDSSKLPVFNSNAIELNINKIAGLSDHFILMNDDMIFTQKVYKSDFFEGKLAKDSAILTPIFPESNFDHIRINNIVQINRIYKKHIFEKNNFIKVFNLKYKKQLLKNILCSPYSRFPGFVDFHLPIPYTRCDWDNASDIFGNIFSKTTEHKFRHLDDVSHWLVRYDRIVRGNFIPTVVPQGVYTFLTRSKEINKALNNPKVKMVCINDEDNVQDFEKYAGKLNQMLVEKFTELSRFEVEE